MTDPLIDRDDLIAVVQDVIGPGGCEPIADAVLDRLRSVLTPEALDTAGQRFQDSSGRWIYRARVPRSGTDLHRLIFGENL